MRVFDRAGKKWRCILSKDSVSLERSNPKRMDSDRLARVVGSSKKVIILIFIKRQIRDPPFESLAANHSTFR